MDWFNFSYIHLLLSCITPKTINIQNNCLWLHATFLSNSNVMLSLLHLQPTIISLKLSYFRSLNNNAITIALNVSTENVKTSLRTKKNPLIWRNQIILKIISKHVLVYKLVNTFISVWRKLLKRWNERFSSSTQDHVMMEWRRMRCGYCKDGYRFPVNAG